MADAPITFFMPLGNDRSNAGLTVRAESVDELNAVLKDLTDSANPDEVSKLNDVIDSVLAIKAGLELKGLSAAQAAPVQKVNHPQANASAPADAPTCAHGNMKWKEGTSKQGNAYKGWFCPAPYGQTQCPAKFIK
jgi:anti-sigma factor ChrR (cupin superfamily)